MNDLSVREHGKVLTGTIRIFSTPAGAIEDFILSVMTPDELARLNADKERLGEEFPGITTDYIEDFDRKAKVSEFIRNTGKLEIEHHNTLMQSPNYGLDIFIQHLIGNTTYPLVLSFAEIGTGSTAPTTMDTALTTPTNRAAVTFQQDYASTDCILNFIFSDSQLANETYYEFGVFCGGTSTIGTGQLFNHALFSTPYAKVAGQDTTVQCDFLFS